LLRYDQKRAVGTSLGALLPPVGIGAVLSYYEAGEIDLTASVFVALGLIVGAFLGARIALGLPSSTVKRMYGVFLMAISLRFIFQI
ncbi:MAG: sulfite exporter TauE/SafE family protein, partial [Thermoleophilia bacterium]|nr:sulfite exporter TauE/SafE family protein [Thermoleophilia bacterium]